MFKGDRLKSLRKEKDLSQQALANMIGVSKSLICCYESGKRTPSLENVISFIQIFGVDADYLLGSDSIVKIVSNDKVSYAPITKEEMAFINEIKKDKLVYNILFTEPKRGAELVIKKLG
ncbi:MAG: helix-turn-helix transcriptional regulator [Bacilli bacterium]|nr:helix-turn-helix transcriptional regulator [Bacilli bacterium]